MPTDDQHFPPRGPSTSTVVVIPGIGGHPAFHKDLITGLQRKYLVHTSPHVDFHHEPCLDWGRHVRFWTEQFHHAADRSANSPAIVGVSFGAHVAHAVRLAVVPEAPYSLTLVSYRHLTRPERRLLRALPRFARVGQYLVGKSLLRISDAQTADPDRLRALRRELYDDERRVRGRLTARLAALASSPPIEPTADGTTFVFGMAERTLLRRHRLRGGTSVVVPGGHDVVVRPSPQLLGAVDKAIRRVSPDRPARPGGTRGRTSMKWYRKLPFPVFSVLLSMVVGLVLWLTKITGESAAILAALGLELVVVVHRILAKVERNADSLHGLLRTAKIEEALSAAEKIIDSHNVQAQTLLEETVNTFCNRVKKLQSGGVQLTPVEFMEFAQRLFESAKVGDRLRATSHLAGGTYWQKAYGQQYERLNRRAQARGLTIERIYVLRDGQHLDEVRDVLDRQTTFSKVRAVLLDEHETDGSLTVPRRDFFGYNNEVTAEFVFAEPNMTVEHIQICTEVDQVQEMAREYARIRDNFSAPFTATTTAAKK